MPNVGSGLQGSCGFAAEGSGNYGTYTAVTRFIEGQADGLKKKKKIAQGTGIAAGRIVDPGARRVVTTREATGSVKAEVLDSGAGLLIAHALGSVAAPRNGNGTIVGLTTTSASAIVGDPTGSLTPADVGATISGTGITAATTILSVQSPWSATMSAVATATGTITATLVHTSYTAYGQSHALGNPQGLSLTTQIGLPQLDGTVKPYTYLGTKIESTEFAGDLDKILMATYAMNARDTTEAQALVPPSYPGLAHPFHFGQANVSLGAFGAEAPVEGIRSVSVKIDPQFRIDRYYQNGTGLKREPVLKDQTKLTASVDADFVVKADLADRFSADTPFSLVWTFTAATNITGATVPASFAVYAPQCFLEDTFDLAGVDIVTGKLPVTITNDGVHAPLVVQYVTADAAV